MFGNCGTKLKNLAMFVLVAGTVLGILVIVVPMMSEFYSEIVWVCIISAAAIIASCYVSALIVYTLGDVWENQDAVIDLLQTRNADVKTKKEVASTSNVNAADGWQCSCGHINNTGKRFCARCGSPRS